MSNRRSGPASDAGRSGPGVAVIETVGGHGGMNDYDFALCRNIVNAGGRATLYTCDKTAFDGSEVFAHATPYRGVYGTSPAWLRGLRFLRGSLQALTAARLQGDRLAHFHFFHVGAVELLSVLLARLLGLRVVVTAHDVAAFKEGLSVPLFVRWAYRVARRVIAHSLVAQRELVQGLGVDPQKIDVINHGNYLASIPASPTRAQARQRLNLTPEQRVLLFFGQIKDVKGLQVLLEGFAIARKQDPSLHLLIAGRVWKTSFAPYQALIDKHQMASACSLHIRYIADEEIPYFYRAADLVVLPYLRIYQSGVALLAMSYGCPVLVSRIEGLLEAVADEQTGFVFDTQNPQHLAQRIGEIFAVPGHAEAVARAGLQHVTLRHDWARLGAQTLACYQRALAQGETREQQA